MINFHVHYDNTSTVLNLSDQISLLELKVHIMNVTEYELNDFDVIICGFGYIEGCLDLILNCFEFGNIHLIIDNSNLYSIVLEKKNDPQKLHNVLCSSLILGKNVLMKQVGYRIGNSSFCKACTNICRQNQNIKNKIIESEIFCMCIEQKDKKCVFTGMNFELEEHKKFLMITEMIKEQCLEGVYQEKLKIKEFVEKQKGRVFDFEQSMRFGLQRVQQYEDKSIQQKILSKVPIKQIENRTAESMKISKLDYKDEFVKNLLAWFRKEFFNWCDQPICKSCNNKGAYCETQTPNSEEAKWLASRTEVYNCNKCNSKLRFPRYNNPEKLIETQTGRCGEWANCFGAILRSLNYEVRFVDNFEDHVWNEYWSESLQRWIHVDSCETAWDTPLVYEQGWGRNMTYILAHSIHGVYDVTRRYVKEWESIEKRRNKSDIDKLSKSIEIKNSNLRSNKLDKIDIILKRDSLEVLDLTKNKELKKHEVVCRQSGSEEWRKDRGELK